MSPWQALRWQQRVALFALLALFVLCALAGCKTVPITMAPVELPPVDIGCDPNCFEACPWPLPKWLSNDWDDLRVLDAATASAYLQCDAQRAACVKCIERGRAAGAIR